MEARNSYLSLLMFLPINRITSPLVQKAKELVTEEEEIGFVFMGEREESVRSELHELYCDRFLNKFKVRKVMTSA